MSRQTIRLLVILSTLSIIAVIATQIYWVKRALALNERQFNQRVFVTLNEVAEEISSFKKVMLHNNPVEQLSSDYFLVNTNTTVEPEVLQHYLKKAFSSHDIITDFEVGIYDCSTDKIMYGVRLSTSSSNEKPASTANWLKTRKYQYYFGVRFPNQAGMAASSLQGWIWSSILVLIAIGFFGYALFVILRQKQLSDIQRDFVNNMTHELQTPISTIKIAADILGTPQIGTQPDRLKKYASIVKDEAMKLQHQVETVLNMAKAEKNKLPLQIEWLDLHQVITAAMAKYEREITLKLDANEPYLNADRFHTTNLITNLVDNALKYSDPKTAIFVKTANIEGEIVLSVEDYGIGIAPEHQKKVFKKFYRVPTGNVHNVKGFGIGLSYVQQIAKAQGWRIALKSELGKGTEFNVFIPM